MTTATRLENKPCSTGTPKCGSLVVFSDDWGRHPSSCQHLVGNLLADYEVLWVNTIGTRSPRLDEATLKRGLEKLAQWLLPKKVVGTDAKSPPVRVASPKMWPWFRSGWDRRLNRTLLRRALAPAIAELPRPVWAITTISLMADLVGQLDVDGWVYYCVDDLASWPGLDCEPLLRSERELVPKVDATIAVSELLVDRLTAMGSAPEHISHGVDLDHWAEKAIRSETIDSWQFEPPWIVFWGLIDERLESDWLLALADRLHEDTILLVGPVESVDTRLREHPRVELSGPVNYNELPALARRSSVLVMPYRDLPATQAMQPLKMKEYLATGLPCVVRRLPATAVWDDCLDAVDTCAEFVERALDRIANGLPTEQRTNRRRLQEESWQAKASQFRRVLDDLASREKPAK